MAEILIHERSLVIGAEVDLKVDLQLNPGVEE
jgi:hypothetical protein